MQYPGDSKGKSAARAYFYNLLTSKKLHEGYHVVIASQFCGDIKYLLGLGVRPERIIACDIDPIARENAGKLGIIVSPFPTIEATSSFAQGPLFKRNGKLASVNVDLCCTLPFAVETMRKVMFHVGYQPLISLTYSRYRDDMRGNIERLRYMDREFSGDMPHTYMEYVSKRDDRDGPGCSPMAIAIWGWRGLRVSIEHKRKMYSKVYFNRHGERTLEASGLSCQVR